MFQCGVHPMGCSSSLKAPSWPSITDQVGTILQGAAFQELTAQSWGPHIPQLLLHHGLLSIGWNSGQEPVPACLLSGLPLPLGHIHFLLLVFDRLQCGAPAWSPLSHREDNPPLCSTWTARP